MNMPDGADAFVGRGRELAEFSEALSTSRLVTLTGGAGVGKSRLARHGMAALDGDTASGERDVCWVGLRSLHQEALLAEAVADALGLADHTARTGVDALLGWIGERELVLVLDSCEHLLDGLCGLVAALLRACPNVTVTVTSRQALGVDGETVLNVGPLAPARAGLALFAHRASEAGSLLRGEEEREVARRLCERLEGIPLAIELAAAQLRSSSLDEVAARIDPVAEAFADRTGHGVPQEELQATGPPGSPAGVVRDAIRWSHDLCDEDEQLVWARLSVIRSSFDLDIARATAAGAPLRHSADIEKALAGLVQKSVVAEDHGRYRMLEAVRDFGRGRLLALGQGDTAADRHAACLRRLVATAHQEWLGPHQAAWYQRAGELYTDTCAAADHLLATDPDAALELLGHVGFFWLCDGHLHEIKHYLARALETSSAQGGPRVRALWLQAVSSFLQGEQEHGSMAATACTAAAEATADPALLRQAAYAKGLGELLQGHADKAHATADNALAIPMPEAPALYGRAGGAAWAGAPEPGVARPPFERGTVLCLLVRVFALTGAGQFGQAREEAQTLRDLCVDHGEYWTRSYLDYQLALIALFEQRADDAVMHARAMLDAKRRIGDSFGIAMGLDITAIAWAHQGQAHRAALAYGAGHQFWQKVGHPQRGTPEVTPLREDAEARARAALGDTEYEEAFHRATRANPASMAEWVARGIPMP